nr:hypothetical protein DO63_5791 [Burkholderia pseudomallei]
MATAPGTRLRPASGAAGVAMSRVDTSKRRSVDTSIRRYADTSIRRPHVRRASTHPHVRAALRRHAVQCRQVDDEVSQLF